MTTRVCHKLSFCLLRMPVMYGSADLTNFQASPCQDHKSILLVLVLLSNNNGKRLLLHQFKVCTVNLRDLKHIKCIHTLCVHSSNHLHQYFPIILYVLQCSSSRAETLTCIVGSNMFSTIPKNTACLSSFYYLSFFLLSILYPFRS